MSLINCPECQKELSDHATECPHCGMPKPVNGWVLKSKRQNQKEGFRILFILIMIIGLVVVAIVFMPKTATKNVAPKQDILNAELVSEFHSARMDAYIFVYEKDYTKEEMKIFFKSKANELQRGTCVLWMFVYNDKKNAPNIEKKFFLPDHVHEFEIARYQRNPLSNHLDVIIK